MSGLSLSDKPAWPPSPILTATPGIGKGFTGGRWGPHQISGLQAHQQKFTFSARHIAYMSDQYYPPMRLEHGRAASPNWVCQQSSSNILPPISWPGGDHIKSAAYKHETPVTTRAQRNEMDHVHGTAVPSANRLVSPIGRHWEEIRVGSVGRMHSKPPGQHNVPVIPVPSQRKNSPAHA